MGGAARVEHVGPAQQRGRIVPRAVARARAGAAGVLPLGLGRQAVAPALRLAQPGGQRLRVVPAHVDHRVVVALREARVAPRVARVTAFEGIAAPRGGGVVVGAPAVAAGAVGHRFGHMARSLEKAPELAHRHLVPAHPECPRDAHLVHRPFVGQLGEAFLGQLRVVARQRLGRLVAAHEEFAGRQSHEGHAQAVAFHGKVVRPHAAAGEAERETQAPQDEAWCHGRMLSGPPGRSEAA
ncbi:hypothetical protein D3C72_1355220 [compost metagenome]